MKNNEVKKGIHSVIHHNMFSDSCMLSVATEYDFRIYCHKKHAVCVPECAGCKYHLHDEMGYGVACVWDETYDAMPKDEHVVKHDEADFEHMRVKNPELYKDMMKAIEKGDFDVVKAWYGID